MHDIEWIKCQIKQVKQFNMPDHIAIIMDGNGRWANKYNHPRMIGHKHGANALAEIVKACKDLSISYLTAFAFSLENWARPQQEIDSIMNYLISGLVENRAELEKSNIRLRIIGHTEYLPKKVNDEINSTQVLLSHNTGMILTIALSYGSRQEIIKAVKKLAMDIDNKNISIDQIDNANFEKYLDTFGLPDPDLMIRTSGEFRLSNFLLWQMAYTEFYFSEVCWPDFDIQELWKALYSYHKRRRKYGKISSSKNIQVSLDQRSDITCHM